MCGPTITGFAKNAGSRMLWPPRCASVPPMKTTSAAPNRPLSSPMVSSSSTRGSAAARPQQARPSHVCHAGGLQLFGGAVEALGLARHQDQEQVRMGAAQLQMRGDHGVVFIDVARLRRRHGAGGDPHRSAPPAAHSRTGEPAAAAWRLEIVLEIAAVAHAGGRGAQGEEAFAHGRRLRQHQVGAGEHRAQDPRQAAVAREGAVGDAAVDDGQRGARALGLAEEVGPDLGFRHHHHRRLQRAQHAPHREHVSTGA